MIRISFIVVWLAMLALEAGAVEPAHRGPHSLRPPKHGGVYVIAHRGAHNGIPENSLPAYRKAIALKVDFIEIDVRATKDGKLVCIHNQRVDGYVEGVSGKVRDLTFDELRRLDIGSRVGTRWKGTRIPTLKECLALCKGKCGIYLDLKEPDIIFDVARAVHASGMEDDVLWYGPLPFVSVMQQLRRRYPNSVLMPDPLTEKGIPYIVERLHPKVIAAVWEHYSPSFVRKCHAAGAIVIVDEKDPSCWADAVAWGSDGIQTDHPARLIEFLEHRPRNEGRR